MSTLDVVLLVVLALAALTGFRAGILSQLGTLAGAAVGLVVGGGVATAVSGSTDLPATPWVVWLAVLGLCVAVGAAVGRAVGGLLGRGVSGVGLGLVDRVLGAVLRLGVVLAVVWVAAHAAVAVGSTEVTRAMEDSVVLRSLDEHVAGSLAHRVDRVHSLDPGERIARG